MASLLYALLVFFAIPIYKELDKIMTKGSEKQRGEDWEPEDPFLF